MMAAIGCRSDVPRAACIKKGTFYFEDVHR